MEQQRTELQHRFENDYIPATCASQSSIRYRRATRDDREPRLCLDDHADAHPSCRHAKLSYQVNNVWYVLTDRHGRTLAGYDSALWVRGQCLDRNRGCHHRRAAGCGFAADLVVGNAGGLHRSGGTAVDAPVIRGQTAHPGLRKPHTTVTWLDGSLTDRASDGNLTGTGGVGFIDYVTGIWWVRPDGSGIRR